MKVFKNILLTLFILTNCNLSMANNAEPKTRKVVGLVVDSETLLPLANVKIITEDKKTLATTNDKGYYEVTVHSTSKKGFKFSLNLEKEEYSTFRQKDNWGDSNDESPIMYFALQKRKSTKGASFSELYIHKGEVNTTVVENYFNDKVKAKSSLNNKIEKLRVNNNHVFFEVDGGYYLVNDYAWIKLNSKDDKISINQDRIVNASEVNIYVQRNNVQNMSSIDSPQASFSIDTFK
ncbi:hypothetical protein LNQ81_15730 [Myroides sp. M-43]|uniref:hypothetical protein n=1 Tax=Myroides oncorhynchi TaxID=2893756 RepID=UPI001E34BB11|nr:hypothetical protein [Myroides oncorhynchi]MCC9044121.1 hypothetical protein [Myroides oncorhynchi]